MGKSPLACWALCPRIAPESPINALPAEPVRKVDATLRSTEQFTLGIAPTRTSHLFELMHVIVIAIVHRLRAILYGYAGKLGLRQGRRNTSLDTFGGNSLCSFAELLYASPSAKCQAHHIEAPCMRAVSAHGAMRANDVKQCKSGTEIA